MNEKQLLGSLAVSVALLAAGLGQTVLTAQTHASATGKAGPATVRVYDKAHKDYHDWNDEEDRSYRAYLSNNHQTYRPIAKLSASQQTKYWNTRHTNDKR